MQFLQRVFSIDTIVKPLPYSMQYNVSRNLSFFTRIFTQFYGKFEYHADKLKRSNQLNNIKQVIFIYLFWLKCGLLADPQGIANAQKSLGLGQEDRVRNVR